VRGQSSRGVKKGLSQQELGVRTNGRYIRCTPGWKIADFQGRFFNACGVEQSVELIFNDIG